MNVRRVQQPKEKKTRNRLGYNSPVQHESYSQAGEIQEIAKAGRNGPS